MKRPHLILSLLGWFALAAMLFAPGVPFAQQSTGAAPAVAPAQQTAPPAAQPAETKAQEPAVTISLDKTALSGGGTITVTGKAPAGKPVFIEYWSDQKVRASRFDSQVDKDTGKRPYILYMTYEMPADFHILVPADKQEAMKKILAEGKDWSYSQALKDLGADVAYSAPAAIPINRHQASLLGSIVGSRGELLPKMDDKETRRRSMQLVKARFRNPQKVLSPVIDVKPDGTYTAKIVVGSGSPPGKYLIRAVVDKDAKTKPLTFENSISFPYVYLSNAGTSVNLLGPFFLTLAIAIFGVLMGAGGGFILNPLLVSIWPFPHTIVAGTVMPTVAFSQASGIYNYSKIKFINWKLGVTIGLSMVAGGFIGPKLTELLTLDQYKFVFGWILIVLSVLMFWQTTPGYLAKNKKEQAILKEFKKKAEESARKKAA